MKKVFKLLVSVIFTACLIIVFGCKKDVETPEITKPTVITTAVSLITTTSATSGGSVISSGGAEVKLYGICWNTDHNPSRDNSKTILNGVNSGTFSSNMAGLTPNTTYYVRAYATNMEGIAYGDEISFTTDQIIADPSGPIIMASAVPILTTTAVAYITIASAASGGKIITGGGGTITDWGLCWSTSPNPTISNSKTTVLTRPDPEDDYFFNNYISGLQASTKYYVRSYATNSAGTGYGNELIFTTLAISSIVFNPDLTYESVSDKDGNSYKTIQIGTQVWMAENLKTTKYNDGTSIPEVTDNTDWKNLTTGGYSWYNNDALSFKSTYGALYNWYAVTDNRNICPTGWHVPTSGEWITLASYLGGENVAGGKAKETGTTHWLSPNRGATNETGFTGIPAGLRLNSSDIQFINIGYSGNWWSTSSVNGLGADLFSVDWASDWGLSNEPQIYKVSGLSVRCLKN